MKLALKLIGLLALVMVFIVGGAILTLPYVLSTDLVKGMVVEAVEEETGRKLAIGGDTSFKLFPNIAVSLEDISFGNPSGMTGAPMVKMAALRTNLKLMPLLEGQFVVDSLTMIKPRFDLQVDKQGRRNWDLKPSSGSAASASHPAIVEGNKLKIGRVTIKDGAVNYVNAKHKITEKVEAINLRLTKKKADASITTTGKLRWNNEIITLNSHIEKPDELLAGKPSMTRMELKSRLVNSTLSGLFHPTAGSKPVFDGGIDLETSSVRELAVFLRRELPKGDGFGKLKLTSQIKAGMKSLKFHSIEMEFDGMSMVAKGIIDLQKKRPHITVDLDFDRLDLTPYLGGDDGASNGVADPETKTKTKTPVDLSALKAIDGIISIKSKEIRYKKIQLDEGRFKVAINKGRANANIESLSLYRGSATGKLVLDGGSSSAFIGGKLSLKDILTGALLRDALGFDKLAGKGTIASDFTLRGNDMEALTRSLKGQLKMTLVDGRVEGFDLARYVGDLTGQKIAGSPASSKNKPMTAYDELSGLIRFNKGVARNDDFLAKGKFFKVRAAGSADLMRQTLRFRVAPKLFSGNWQFAPPLRITGRWSKPQVTLDAFAFFSGRDSIVRSFSGALRGEKLELGDVLKSRGLQTDQEIETYLAGKKIDTRNDKPANDNAPEADKLLKKRLP